MVKGENTPVFLELHMLGDFHSSKKKRVGATFISAVAMRLCLRAVFWEQRKIKIRGDDIPFSFFLSRKRLPDSDQQN